MSMASLSNRRMVYSKSISSVYECLQDCSEQDEKSGYWRQHSYCLQRNSSHARALSAALLGLQDGGEYLLACYEAYC